MVNGFFSKMTTIIPIVLKFVIMVVPFFTFSPFDDCVTWVASPQDVTILNQPTYGCFNI